MLYYIRIIAEVSQILVSCETPIQWEQFCLVFITSTCSIWYFIQFVRNGISIFMSLHGQAAACILVASASPIHIPPVQHVLKHCGAHKHILYINI